MEWNRRPGAVVFRLAPLAVLGVVTSLACTRTGTTPPAATPGAPPQAVIAPTAAAAATTTHGPVVEEIHGVQVSDPYRWLEDGDAPDVKAWQAAQSQRTRSVLDAIPARPALLAQTRALFQAAGDVSPPSFARPKQGPELYFHTKRAGGADQSTLYVREGTKGADRPLIDPSRLTTDPTTAIDWWYPSNDGAFVAYGYSTSGTELSTLHVRDVRTGADVPDAIPYTRYATVAWVPDDKGFYYTRFPEPGTVPAGEEQSHKKVFFHRLGNDWHKDKVIFERPDKEDRPDVLLSPGGRWLVATVEQGESKSEVFVRDRSKGDGAAWVPVVVGVPALFDAIPREERLYVLTNDGAPNWRLYSVEYDHPDRKLWREVLPEKKDALANVTIHRSQLVATYLHDASSRLERFTLGGKSLGAIPLPTIGSATVRGPWDSDEAFVGFESFVVPEEVLRVNPRTGKTEAWDVPGELPGMSDVETTMTYATSKDGTKIPMFLVAKKGTPRDGANPTLLWGYGGFNVSQTPTFRPYAALTAEHGGVFASAILRGGGEFGEAWHKAGMLGNKQNVFDDYAACAQELIAEKVTSPEKLAAIGRSNGGLLVAAAIVQHPELFRAAVAIVPLTDMLRYPRFRIGRWWVTEYGDPAKDDDFKWLYAYSPYHHVKDGVHYPATLFSTGESDNRVNPMHSRKMAARLEDAQGDPSRPVLLRVNASAGHGQGKPASKLIDQVVDELGFVFSQLGVAK